MPNTHPRKPRKPGKPESRRRPGHGRPNPENPRRKRGRKPQRPFGQRGRPPRSGSIPRPCRKLRDSPALLDCWLRNNPAVANAIVWETAHGISPTPLAWPDWTKAMKDELRQAWMDARAWHDGGMTQFTGTFIEDPPPNQDHPPDDAEFFRTVFDARTQAFPLYLAIVAQSLAAEIDGWVPWSLRGYDSESLEQLLSGMQMFRHDTDDGGKWDADHPGGYVLGGTNGWEQVTPAHPTCVYRFLADHQLIGDTLRGTVARLVDWCRWNMSHFLNKFTPRNAEYHWQYRGQPPVRRIIEGTVLHDPAITDYPTPRHWTAGCWGTTAFLRSVLRAVNIPVLRVHRCKHTMPHFVGAARYLSHGDDPYTSLAKADYPAELLLIDQDTFESLLPYDPDDPHNPEDNATCCQNVGRRPVDLAVWHFSDWLLDKFCSDEANGLDHAHGKIYLEVFAPSGYALHQLEAALLWQRLATAAKLKGKC